MRITDVDYKDPRVEFLYARDYLLIDPPWDFDDKRPRTRRQLKYSLWGPVEKEIPRLFSAIDCKGVFMWCPNSFLEQVILAKGGVTSYQLKTVITWNKMNAGGKSAYGTGSYFRNSTEQILVFVRRGERAWHSRLRTSFQAVTGPRTEKPKMAEREIMEDIKGSWSYIFSGPNVDEFRELDVVCLDSCFAQLDKGFLHLQARKLIL